MDGYQNGKCRRAGVRPSDDRDLDAVLCTDHFDGIRLRAACKVVGAGRLAIPTRMSPRRDVVTGIRGPPFLAARQGRVGEPFTHLVSSFDTLGPPAGPPGDERSSVIAMRVESTDRTRRSLAPRSEICAQRKPLIRSKSSGAGKKSWDFQIHQSTRPLR